MTLGSAEQPERVSVLSATASLSGVLQVEPVMGGEDFSQYGRTDAKIPSLIYWVGAADPVKWQAAQNSALGLPSLHSPFFSPDFEPTIETGVNSMTATALALFDGG